MCHNVWMNPRSIRTTTRHVPHWLLGKNSQTQAAWDTSRSTFHRHTAWCWNMTRPWNTCSIQRALARHSHAALQLSCVDAPTSPCGRAPRQAKRSLNSGADSARSPTPTKQSPGYSSSPMLGDVRKPSLVRGSGHELPPHQVVLNGRVRISALPAGLRLPKHSPPLLIAAEPPCSPVTDQSSQHSTS